MFKLNEKDEIIRNILKCDHIRYSPSEISTIKTANSQIYIPIYLEKIEFFILLNNYLEIHFDALQAASNNRYADNLDIRLVNLGPLALFSNYVNNVFRKQFENIDHAHIVSLMYKLITIAGGCEDLSIGVDPDRIGRQRALTKNKKKWKENIMFKLC